MLLTLLTMPSTHNQLQNKESSRVIWVQVLGAVLSHGPERDVLPARTIVSCIAVKQVLVPAVGAIAFCDPYNLIYWGLRQLPQTDRRDAECLLRAWGSLTINLMAKSSGAFDLSQYSQEWGCGSPSPWF